MNEKTIKFNEGLQSLHHDKMAELKKLLPNLFDKDGNLIKAELENFVTGYTTEKQEPFCFSWAGKQKAKGLSFKQSEIKLALKFDEERSKNFKTTQNLIIEGDNLQVLKLLVPSYKNKVKCIYIDPPYNTQHEFIYPDNYATSELDYLLESGQIEDGQDISGQNAKEKNTGRKHSNWLSFMYPRLVLARELLREDGVIFVSIDDNEVHHLRQIMNEIFGEEEFVGCFIHVQNSAINYGAIKDLKEYIFVYSKNKDIAKFKLELDEVKQVSSRITKVKHRKFNIVFPSGIRIEGINNEIFSGTIGGQSEPIEIISKEMIFENGLLKNDCELSAEWSSPNIINTLLSGKEAFDKKGQQYNEIFFNSKGIPQYSKSNNEISISNILDFVGDSTSATFELRKLFNTNKDLFTNPKPVSLIKHLLQISTAPNDLILDFFAGSGTTGQAVMELNQEEIDKQAKDGLLADKEAEVGGRRFILVQLPEKIDNKKEAFKFCKNNNLEPVISNITIERIRRAGEKYKSVDNGFKVLELTESAIDRKLMNKSIATKEEIFAEIACSYGYGLNYQYRDLHNLGKGITYLKGNNRQALIILGEEQMNNQTLAEIVLYSDHLKECQIFAQDACLNVEIIHNLYQHFEQKRVVIV